MSRKVLYISANPKAENESFGLQVGRKLVTDYKLHHPNDEITELNLFETKVPLLSASTFEAFAKLQKGTSFELLNDEQKDIMSAMNALLAQFIEADVYIFVSPMWNFSIPPVLKAYIDVVMQAGKTFHYTENGPEGLLKNKKAIHVQASGGIYSNGRAANMEFGHSYLKTVLGFMGVADVEWLAVEGIAAGNANLADILSQSKEQAQKLAEAM